VKTNPIKPNLVRRRRIAKRVKLMQSVYLQRITKKNAAKGFEKTKPIKIHFPQRVKLMQGLYLQRIMKIKGDMGSEKQTQTNPVLSVVEWANSPPILKIQFSILLSCIKY